MHPGCSRRLAGDCAHVRARMWVIYGRVSSLEMLLARASRHSAPAFHDGDHHAHRHVLISVVGGAHDDRPGWPPNKHRQ